MTVLAGSRHDVRRAAARVETRPSTSAAARAVRDPGVRWTRLPAEGRLHAHHGPIDLVVGIDADEAARARAERAVRDALEPLLATLAAELAELRRELGGQPHVLHGPVARRMLAAVARHPGERVTPMAAVAGAVADHALAAMRGAAALRRAFVNNGGDVALHLDAGETLRVGVGAGREAADEDGNAAIVVGADDRVGGVATSGWGGRSHSLGIADRVTVLAADAAAADVAATLVANACDLPGSARVRRVPALELSPDSDLGERAVTVGVARLDAEERRAALDAAVGYARALLRRGTALGVRIELQGESRTLGRRARAGTEERP